MKLVVTGGAGFIGSNFVRWEIASDPSVEVTTLDALIYAGNLANLEPVRAEARHRFVHGDVADRDGVFRLLERGVDAIVHFAAESHVDRSIDDSAAFLRTNVLGTQVLLEGARRFGVKRFLHISTDEVYGTLGPEGRFTEESPLRPSSPYAASKAAADLLVLSYVRTYGIDAVTTRCSNNFGPYQYGSSRRSVRAVGRPQGGLWRGCGLGRAALPSRGGSDRARSGRGARDPGRHRDPLPVKLLGGGGAPAARRAAGRGVDGRQIVNAGSRR